MTPEDPTTQNLRKQTNLLVCRATPARLESIQYYVVIPAQGYCHQSFFIFSQCLEAMEVPMQISR